MQSKSSQIKYVKVKKETTNFNSDLLCDAEEIRKHNAS